MNPRHESTSNERDDNYLEEFTLRSFEINEDYFSPHRELFIEINDLINQAISDNPEENVNKIFHLLDLTEALVRVGSSNEDDYIKLANGLYKFISHDFNIENHGIEILRRSLTIMPLAAANDAFIVKELAKKLRLRGIEISEVRIDEHSLLFTLSSNPTVKLQNFILMQVLADYGVSPTLKDLENDFLIKYFYTTAVLEDMLRKDSTGEFKKKLEILHSALERLLKNLAWNNPAVLIKLLSNLEEQDFNINLRSSIFMPGLTEIKVNIQDSFKNALGINLSKLFYDLDKISSCDLKAAPSEDTISFCYASETFCISIHDLEVLSKSKNIHSKELDHFILELYKKTQGYIICKKEEKNKLTLEVLKSEEIQVENPEEALNMYKKLYDKNICYAEKFKNKLKHILLGKGLICSEYTQFNLLSSLNRSINTDMTIITTNTHQLANK